MVKLITRRLLRPIANWVMRSRADKILRRIEECLDSDTFLVGDVGSGTGHNAEALRRQGHEVHQFDVSDLHWVGESPTRIVEDQIPASDETYDRVLLVHVLQYPNDPKRILQEVHRILKLDGLAIVLQSTYRVPWTRLFFQWKEFVFGPVGFWLARASTLIRNQPNSVRPARYYHQPDLHRFLVNSAFEMRHMQSRNGFVGMGDQLFVLGKVTR